MIEVHFFPIHRRVAIRTYIAELAIVDIVIAVAIEAGARCFTVPFSILVTSIAFGIQMLADQVKVRKLMIEYIFV
ncbi:MAG: hypothetical protein OEW68_13235 [Gammaproteobacteria bacterium]|nr:hypothetical protein [Gammaproteobacteria bacterium]